MARLAAFALALALAGCASPVRDSSAYEASPDRPDAIPDRERTPPRQKKQVRRAIEVDSNSDSEAQAAARASAGSKRRKGGK